MRFRRVAFGAAAIAAASFGALTGCGQKFEIPTETPAGQVIPGDGEYDMEATWVNLPGVRDLLYTSAGQLYVLQNGSGVVELDGYFRFKPVPERLNYPFNTLFNPVQLTDGANPGRVFVLDQGDTCAARGNCSGPTPGNPNQDLVDLSKYWRVREFSLVGAGLLPGMDTVSTFTDTSMAWVEGIAADNQGRVYVSGLAIVLIADELDNRIKTRSFLWRIYRYKRGSRYPGVTPPDHNLPGAAWHRDTTWFVEEGAGTGFLDGVRGIHWRSTPAGSGLFASEVDNNRAQKLYDDLTSTGYFQITEDGVGDRIVTPLDVYADELGSVYVADTGNRRVLRFDANGNFIQRVDVDLDAQSQALENPVTVAADSLVTFVGDRARGKVIRYRRRL